MSFLQSLVEGTGQLLVTDDVGFAWRSNAGGKTPLWPVKLPDTPNRGVAINVYDLTDDPALADSEKGLQFTLRSEADDVTDLWALEQQLNDQLLGRYPLTLPTGVDISTLVHTSSSSPQQDEKNRWRMTVNYTALLHRPTPFRH